MLAIEITQAGKPSVLQSVDRPKPSPNEYEVLIQVAAAGVNGPDIMQRKGLYPAPPGASNIPGLEIAGIVTATGAKVTHLQEGDPVCALVPGGGYAQYCLASAELCLPIPASLTLQQAAALPETFFTVWSNVFDRGQLKKGETLLVHGGSSGIGTTAIQLANVFAAGVIVTAGSDTKCRFCEQLGAYKAINYNKQDFVAEIMKTTANKGVDVILDIVGGDYFPRNLKCLAEDGRLVQIAIQKGPKTAMDLLPVMLKRLTITGSTLRARSVAFKAEIARHLFDQVWPHLADGRIKPIIDQTFPLQEAAKAHERMESSQHIGKIILTV